MEFDELVVSTVAHDQDAWQELLARITPSIRALTGAHPALRKTAAGARPDDVAEVTTGVISRLARDDYKNLRSYLSQRGLEKPQTFESWLYGAVDYTIRDHLRSRFGRAPRSTAPTFMPRPSKSELNTRAGAFDEEQVQLSLGPLLGLTTRLELANVIRYMQTHFAPEELLAMQLHYGEEMSLAELALRLQLPDARSADKLIRRLTARLRHHFAAAD